MSSLNNPYKPNTASVPNILFDYWMPRLTPGEFKVLMAIARKTYGWNKTKDNISLRQIEEMTGLARKSISQMIDALVERNLIIKIKSKTEWGDDAPNQYEINIDCEEGVGNCIGGGSNLSSLPVGTSGNYGVVTSGNPQNTLYTKDTIQKREEAAPPPARSKFKKEKKEEVPKSAYRDNVFLTESEHQKLLSQYGQPKLDKMLDLLHAKKGANGNKYVSDYHVLLPANWVNQAYDEGIKKGKIEKISSPPSTEIAIKNKKLCETAESKLGGRYTSTVFFQAGPNAALLFHGPKDLKKEYPYDSYSLIELKELLLRDLEQVFPGAREMLLPPVKNKVTELMTGLAAQVRMSDSC